MSHVTRLASVVLFCTLVPLAAQEGKFAIKVTETTVPKDVAPAIAGLLEKKSVQLQDAGGKAVCEVWFRKEIPADATPEQIKNGLTYREVKQTEVLGVIRFEQDWLDYRKQKVKAGVYTLRLGYQPSDGDHAGTSEFQEFCVVVDAKKDMSAKTMEPMDLIRAGADSIKSSHPGVFMLFPNTKPKAEPELAAKPKHHWVVMTKGAIEVKGKKTEASLGLGLTLVGHGE